MWRTKTLLCLIGCLSIFFFPSRSMAQQEVMVDKVVAVVGNSMILYSDLIQTSKALAEQRRQQGYTSDRDPLCEALEHLILQKILYNQAQIDSISIASDNIARLVEEALQREMEERGSQRALEQFYHKPIYEIRSDLMNRYEEMQYAMTMESTIKEKTTIIPGEVERYYKSLPKDSLPLIPEQYVYSQIVRYPPSIEEAKLRTRTRLLEMRERILKGTSFELLARMYSEDPGSTLRGGEMEPMPKESFVQPFADAMVKLKPGQVSEVVETEYGFHLIQLLDVKGSLYHVRHILMKPQFTVDELQTSFILFDSLRNEIQQKKLTFEEAVAQYSDDRFSKNNGGVVSNLEMMEAMNHSDARAASTSFLREELPPEVYKVMRNMKEGDISEPFASQDYRGNILCRMIRLDKIIPSHPATLSGDFLRVEEMALQAKQNKEYKEWLDKIIDGMFIRVSDEFKSCEFENKSLLK